MLAVAAGQVANGGDEDRAEPIQGAVGIQMRAGSTISNSGTLMGTGAYSFGAEMYTSGRPPTARSTTPPP